LLVNTATAIRIAIATMPMPRMISFGNEQLCPLAGVAEQADRAHGITLHKFLEVAVGAPGGRRDADLAGAFAGRTASLIAL
jgi:hypothetical protein